MGDNYTTHQQKVDKFPLHSPSLSVVMSILVSLFHVDYDGIYNITFMIFFKLLKVCDLFEMDSYSIQPKAHEITVIVVELQLANYMKSSLVLISILVMFIMDLIRHIGGGCNSQ